MKKHVLFVAIFSIVSSLFAVNDISLMDTAKKEGITLYWDSLSETGMLEKNGHQITFRKDESIVMLDNVRFELTDAPELKNNKIYVSKKFMNDADQMFKENNSTMFKVGAILVDAGHGGQDPGALKTYKINGKDVTIQEKDVNLKVAKLLG